MSKCRKYQIFLEKDSRIFDIFYNIETFLIFTSKYITTLFVLYIAGRQFIIIIIAQNPEYIEHIKE